MATREIQVQRFSVTSSKSFEDVVALIDAAVGHPDMRASWGGVTAVKTYSELEKAISNLVGSSGLMEFTPFDLGEVLRKEPGTKAPDSASGGWLSAHNEKHGRACTRRRFLRSRNHSHR